VSDREQNLEGVVANRLNSRYESGQRSGAWVKVKNFETRTFTVGGFIEADGGAVEAILVGHCNRGRCTSLARWSSVLSPRSRPHCACCGRRSARYPAVAHPPGCAS